MSEGNTVWLKGWCAMCLQNDCGMLIRMEDGVVTETIGDPDTPTNRGKLCMRGGLASIPGYYDPKRVRSPMRRTNPKKGLTEDPGWEAISWDEAYALIGSKMRAIRASDPRKMAFMEGWGVCDELFAREIMLKNPETGGMAHGSIFATAFGTPNNVPSHGILCPIHFASNLVHAQHPEQIADLEYCTYLIAPGRTVGGNTVCPHSTARLTRALERGMKLVVIDPRHSPEASKAHRWLPILPGTELAFALAMIHGILFELGTYDEHFLKERTNAPYLISPDGTYLRDAQSGKPLMLGSDGPRPFDQVRDPILDADLEVEGEPVSTGFRLLKNGMRLYTPEWAEKITGITAEDIRTVTREFVEHACLGKTIVIDGFEFPFRPVQMGGSGRGACSHRNGTHFDLCVKIINMLMGAMELPGACTGGSRPGPCPDILRPDEDGTVTPIVEAVPRDFHFPPHHIDGGEFFPHKHTTPPIVVRNILDPKRYHLDYDIELFIFAGANPVRSISDQDLWIQAMSKVPLVVSININFDETSCLADIILPVSHFLEKDGIRIYKPPLQSIDDDLRGLEMILARNPVPRRFDTKSSDQILYDLARAGGFLPEMHSLINRMNRLSEKHRLDPEREYPLEDIWDRLIAELFGDGHSYRSAQAAGQLYKYTATGKKGYNYFYWPGSATRHPFYFERLPRTAKKLRENLRKAGIRHPAYVNEEKDFFAYYTGVPFWFPSHVREAPPEYDLYVINWKTGFRLHGTGGNMANPWINELREDDPYEMFIHIHPATAKEKSLDDGQEVWVESMHGKTRGKLRLTGLIHPKVLGIPGNYGGYNEHYINPVMPAGGAWFNILLPAEEAENLDPISGGLDNSPKVKVYPIGRQPGVFSK
ncbi:MAG: molybdopterin-dependent oxidoreductase [Deltaproteobacteria bacterium]|jgi:anaerobic selenocysteine-containing dehydrogenase|nr:molybdopterin-dependent oxidoreductase [Deltaproteobacteria bacterium]